MHGTELKVFLGLLWSRSWGHLIEMPLETPTQLKGSYRSARLKSTLSLPPPPQFGWVEKRATFLLQRQKARPAFWLLPGGGKEQTPGKERAARRGALEHLHTAASPAAGRER